MSPVTLITVLKTSGIASAAMSRPIPSTGSPTASSTGAVTANIPPLGMPGLLKLIASASTAIVAICPGPG